MSDIQQDWLEALVAQWSSEGRSEEQIYGVQNFISGKGPKILAHLAAEKEAAITRERIRVVRDLIWHHSIADYAEQGLIDKINEWEAELSQAPQGKKGE